MAAFCKTVETRFFLSVFRHGNFAASLTGVSSNTVLIILLHTNPLPQGDLVVIGRDMGYGAQAERKRKKWFDDLMEELKAPSTEVMLEPLESSSLRQCLPRRRIMCLTSKRTMRGCRMRPMRLERFWRSRML